MARVAFFTETLPPNGDIIGRFAWDLIHALAEQNHEIRVFSTYREGEELPPSHSRIEIIRPFKKWSLLELPRVVPLLLAFRPDVLHFVQPHQEALTGFSNAMELIPSMKSLIGNPAMVASFFDLDQKSLRRHRLLLQTMRALTVSNQTQNDLVVEHFGESLKPQISVLPMGFAIETKVRLQPGSEDEIVISETDELENVRALKDRFPHLIAVAGPIETHDDPEVTFRTLAQVLKTDLKASAILLHGWGRLPVRTRHLCEEIIYEAGVADRVLLTGPLNEADELECLKLGQAVLVAPMKETRLAFTKFLRTAQRGGTPLVLSLEQAQMDPIGWRDNENALIRARRVFEMGDALLLLLRDTELRNRLKTETFEFSRKDVSDHPANLVSRLYSRLLS